MYEIIYQPIARFELQEIYHYIKLDSPIQAQKWRDGFLQKIEQAP